MFKHYYLLIIVCSGYRDLFYHITTLCNKKQLKQIIITVNEKRDLSLSGTTDLWQVFSVDRIYGKDKDDLGDFIPVENLLKGEIKNG
nr:MAG TPA: hypothetical protein [Caudoviricetes sp.]